MYHTHYQNEIYDHPVANLMGSFPPSVLPGKLGGMEERRKEKGQKRNRSISVTWLEYKSFLSGLHWAKGLRLATKAGIISNSIEVSGAYTTVPVVHFVL